jgi:chromosomal replication initiation ATPase DnaA
MTAISLARAGLVGRTAELGALFDLVDRVRERDRFRALVVRGEPGIGKTSLLTAIYKNPFDAGRNLRARMAAAGHPVPERDAA